MSPIFACLPQAGYSCPTWQAGLFLKQSFAQVNSLIFKTSKASTGNILN
jgi:hypothetical protein